MRADLPVDTQRDIVRFILAHADCNAGEFMTDEALPWVLRLNCAPCSSTLEILLPQGEPERNNNGGEV